MSVRASGFARVPADLYQTPAWVVDALAEHVNLNGLAVWEPACGAGQMVRALQDKGASVTASDITDHGFDDFSGKFDFASAGATIIDWLNAIITNPPYGPQGRTGAAFIARGLERLPPGGLLALLLPVDFDSAKTRAKFFGDCPDFAAKIVLRRRICWFEPEPGQAGPSANHAWFIWQRSHLRTARAPVTLYAPAVERVLSNLDRKRFLAAMEAA